MKIRLLIFVVSNNFSIGLMKRRRRAWSVNAHLHVVAVCRQMGTVSKICGTAGNVSYSCLCLSCCWSFSLAPAIEKTEVTQRTRCFIFFSSRWTLFWVVSCWTLRCCVVLVKSCLKALEDIVVLCTSCGSAQGEEEERWAEASPACIFLLLFKSVGCYTCMLVSLRYQHGTGLVAYRCSKKLYRSMCICL